MMEAITHQVWIKASARRVYDAVTQQEGLTQWWITKATVKPEIGFINKFDEGKGGITPMQITALQPHSYVAWKCLLTDEWQNTTISFDITEQNGAVILNFRHDGWRAQTEYFSICNFHWARHLLMLKNYCETGKGRLDENRRENWGELHGLVNG
ncbi:SRPBCC family protein [Mucilaginibacter hurinus]|nr:SRPBCC domain-containing protein [Mucilaginibacter hurinus]